MGTFTAGRIGGIPVRISPSWFLAVALSTSLMGTNVYPTLLPDTPEHARWALALATSLLFFFSILLHELAHAAVACRFGIPVASITLFLLGGVAQIAHEVKRPVAELLIAAAGPLTSLALGGLFMLPVLLGHHRGQPLVVGSTWLGLMNLSVGLFNLVPGFPMDGGRLLRAAIWACGAGYRTATRIACLGGRLVAFLAIGVGVAAVMRLPLAERLEVGPFGGLWLVLVGLYLERSARQSLVVQQLLERLGRFSAADLMLRDVPVIRAGARIRDFLPGLVSSHDCEAAFVADFEEGDDGGGRMIGMVLRGRAITVPQRDHDRLTARDLMLPAEAMRPAAPEDDAAGLLQRLEIEGLAAVPVVSSGEVLGLIGRAMLVRHAVEPRGRL